MVLTLLNRDPLNTVTRRFYMDHFDFTGMRVDNAFRCVVIAFLDNRVELY
jgi:Sec7-like guanine-nucleotide exchange factor